MTKIYNMVVINSTFLKDGPNLSFFLELETRNRNRDDFEEIFDGIGLKIISFILWIIFQSFTNIYFIFMIFFEKFGGKM